MANEVKFEVTLEEKQALDAIKKLTNSVEDFGKKAEDNFGGASQAFNSFKGNLAAQAVLKGFELLTSAASSLFNVIATEGVQSAIAQEEALTRLNTSLELAGNGSAKASADLLKFANDMEKLTGVQDDVILNNLALLQSFGPLTTEGLKAASAAAKDLSVKFGVDLETAVRAIGASAQGNLGLLQRITKQTFEQGATNADTFEAAIRRVNELSLGSAEKQMQTYAGTVTSARNAFGNFTEELGRLITGNEAVKEAIKLVGKVFEQLEEFVYANKETINEYIKDGVNLLIDAFKTTVTFVKSVIDSFNESGSILNNVKENFLRVVEVIKIFIASASESGGVVNTIINYFLALVKTIYNLQSIIFDLVGLGFSLLTKALGALGISLDDVWSIFKKLVGFITGSFVSALETSLFALSKIVGIFDKDLAEKIQGAITPIKEFSQALRDGTESQVADAKKLTEEKQKEVDSHVKGEEAKTNATTKGALIRRGTVLSDLNFVLELERAKQEDLKKFQNAEKLFRGQGERELFNILVDGLGKREAARVASEVLRLENEKKYSEARLLLLTSEENARKEIEKRQQKPEEQAPEIVPIDFLTASLQGQQEIKDFYRAQELEFAAQHQQDLYNTLVTGLGQQEAAQLIYDAKKLSAEGKAVEARNKLAMGEIQARKNIDKMDQDRQKEKEGILKQSLGTIANLQYESNRELFYIGKAAAIANATISGLEGYGNALRYGPPLGPILAGLIAVASAANIARIVGTQPPSRQTGGLLPGVASPTDTTLFQGAPGELVLNRRQQTNLFNAINQNQIGNENGGIVVNIQGNVMADDDSQVQRLIERINDNIQFRNAALVG